jgi:hypothetical protein
VEGRAELPRTACPTAARSAVHGLA